MVLMIVAVVVEGGFVQVAVKIGETGLLTQTFLCYRFGMVIRGDKSVGNDERG